MIHRSPAFLAGGGDVGPADDGGRPGQAAAEGYQQQVVAGADRLLIDELGQGDADRRGAGIAVALHVDNMEQASTTLHAMGFEILCEADLA